VNHIHTPNNKR